jgi:molybdopterin-guanine dinucleotide biosynthesis protein A
MIEGVTLGILAGGRATRLGGIDKAWLQRDGEPQVLRLVKRLGASVDVVLVSVNVDPHRYVEHGLETIPDQTPGIGPLGGLQALAAACRTRWLLTVPVDLIDVNDCLLATLSAHRGCTGSFAVDDDGPQPLVALWSVQRLQEAIAQAISRYDFSIQALQRALSMSAVQLAGVRFGNLNTPADLIAAKVESSP